MMNKQFQLMLVCALLGLLCARSAAAFDKWDIEITPALHRMIVKELAITDADARTQADAIFHAYEDESNALDETYNDLGAWNGGLAPGNHGAIDDEFIARIIANTNQRDEQERALRWAVIDEYFDQLAAIPGIDPELLARVRQRHRVLLILNNPLGMRLFGVRIGLDELTLRDLPTFDDDARRVLRDAIDAYTIGIQPLVQKYEQATAGAWNRSSSELFNAIRKRAVVGDIDGAHEIGRELIKRQVALMNAMLPIRAAHDRLVANVCVQLTPEQATEFRRATTLLWSPAPPRYVELLFKMERALAEPELSDARRNALTQARDKLDAIIGEKLRTVEDVLPRCREPDWQRSVFQFTVDSIIAGASGGTRPTTPPGLQELNMLITQNPREQAEIEQAVRQSLPDIDEERHP